MSLLRRERFWNFLSQVFQTTLHHLISLLFFVTPLHRTTELKSGFWEKLQMLWEDVLLGHSNAHSLLLSFVFSSTIFNKIWSRQNRTWERVIIVIGGAHPTRNGLSFSSHRLSFWFSSCWVLVLPSLTGKLCSFSGLQVSICLFFLRWGWGMLVIEAKVTHLGCYMDVNCAEKSDMIYLRKLTGMKQIRSLM